MQIPIILHISDLHFGKTHNPNVAKDLLADLGDIDPKPNVVVVSGDLSWRGERSSLEQAKSFLDNIKEKCGISDEDAIIVVPGNHDLGFFKRRVSIRWALSNYLRFFQAEPTRFFPNLGIAIFGFNSNILKLSQLVADGKIGDDQLHSLRERYNQFKIARNTGLKVLDGGSTKIFLESFKIAVVHHHPVPLPRAMKENFNILRDAGNFLELLTHFNFDLILHGHQHYPFVFALEYRSRFRIQRKLLVVAAGTSTSCRHNPPGFNQYSIISMNPWDPRRPVSIQWRTHHGISYGPFHEPSFEYLLGEPEVPMEQNLLDIIAASIGYKRLKFIILTHINPDGSCVDEILVRIRSAIDRLRRVHVQLTSDPPSASRLKIEVPHKDCEAVDLDPDPDTQGNYFIYFSPDLRVGQEVEFKLIEETSNPVFRMSLAGCGKMQFQC
jgi:3',5'-cyclic AMP phosphodiesterase CpdA